MCSSSLASVRQDVGGWLKQTTLSQCVHDKSPHGLLTQTHDKAKHPSKSEWRAGGRAGLEINQNLLGSQLQQCHAAKDVTSLLVYVTGLMGVFNPLRDGQKKLT